MYISPNTIVKIIKDVPLDNTYDHTVKFSNITAQINYFSSGERVKYNLSNQTYQRVAKNKIRVEVVADNLYDCNYMMFQNTSFGTKWFYAFITKVEYINNVTSEITYEIDVMQTYLFDITIGECYVEREHVTDDRVGANTIKEPILCPDAEVHTVLPLTFSKWRVVIQSAPGFVNQLAYTIVQLCQGVIDTPLPTGSSPEDVIIKGFLYFAQMVCGIIKPVFAAFAPDTPAQFREHMFSGCNLYFTDHYIGYILPEQTEANNLATYIDRHVALGNRIVNIYQIPDECINGFDTAPFNDFPVEYLSPPEKFWSLIEAGNTGYKPKNNKLYTSPYMYLVISNKQGGEMELAYEKIVDKNARFTMYSSWSNGQCDIMLQVSKYGCKNTQNCNAMRLPLSNFPVCTWNENGILNKLTQFVRGIASSPMRLL